MKFDKKITIKQFLKKKQKHEKIKMITAYDYTFAKIIDSTEIDGILIGDSLGMVMQGNDNTLPVTVDQVVYHTKCVTAGVKRVHVVADMPFLSYQVSLEYGIKNAGRLIKEGGAHAVKIEGGERVASLISKLSEMGIPVMGHIGLTPQSIHNFGGYRIQGRSVSAKDKLLNDALALEQAGVYSIVLEGIPSELAGTITSKVSVPTIGIGAGVNCDGQILVIQDLLGMDPDFNPKFLKKFHNLYQEIQNAINQYCTEVATSEFPDEEHSFFDKSSQKGKK